MKLYALSFLTGISTLYLFSTLPSLWPYLALSLVFILLLFFKLPSFYLRLANLILVFLIGLIWVMLFSYKVLAWTLPTQFDNQPVEIKGTIASIPTPKGRSDNFIFHLTEFNHQTVNTNIKLNWYATAKQNLPYLRVGDSWQFQVKLKRPHNLANPGSFDSEKFSFSEGLRASGYIINGSDNKLIATSRFSHPIDKLRQMMLENMQGDLAGKPYAAFIYALTIGEKFAISSEEWQIFQNTGTNHLMAIAGLHIGFVAGLVFLLCSFLWRRIPHAPLWLATPVFAGISSLGSAIIYSALAGFAIPTQRAVVMLAVFLIGIVYRRYIAAWQSLTLALVIVLILNPLSILEVGFWLSFAAVALIAYGLTGRFKSTTKLWKYTRLQLTLGIGLIPFTLLFFSNASFISPLANSIAIPWVGFITVPLSLLGALLSLIFPWLGAKILILSEWTLHGVWAILSLFSHQTIFSWQHLTQHNSFILAAIIGMLLLLAPRGMPHRYLGLVFITPLIWFVPAAPMANQVWFTLLDVGQGLSAVVQTQHHVLVFDTGAKFSQDYDMGSAVVVPFLRYENIKKIDALVISHGDNDHIGGSGSVLQAFPVKYLETSVPNRFTQTNVSTCLRGESWQWDEVNFAYLYPSAANLGLDNDSSCVLKISVGQQQILLTGDIEKAAEHILLQHADELKSTIIVAPHHGSDTSSTPDFVQAVNPLIVLFPVGYLNRFGFPKPIVSLRYQTLGAKTYDTAENGAIMLQLTADSSQPVIHLWRQQKMLHVWNS